ncbi:MAG: hypothetical protein Phyf2KO_05570 [Phycisphaerales bacterium]
MSTDQAQAEQPIRVQGVVGKISSLISALSLRSESPSMFYKHAAAAIVQGFRSPYGTISVRFGSEIVEDYWHTGSTDPSFWKKPVEDLLNTSLQEAKPIARRFSARDASFQIALISIILRDISGSMIGVMSLVVRCTEDFTAEMYRELLESFSAQMAIGASRIEEAGKVPEDSGPDASISKAAGYTSGVEMAFALVSSLRSKLGCEQAAIGIADGAKVRVQAVSGLDEVSNRAEAVRLMSDAMGEAVDRGESIIYQNNAAKGTESDQGYRVHKRWFEQLGGSSVASIPLDAGNGATMIVSMRRRPELPFNAEEMETVENLMTPYAPAFGLIDKANRSVLSHAKKSISEGISETFKPRGWGRKIFALVLLSAMAWVAFGTMGYHVNAPASVRPTTVRSVSAPVEGTLLSAFVTAGDYVTEGQLLATFDDSELRVQREQFLAEIQIAQINENRAISDGAGVDAELARAERRLSEARLVEVDRQIAQSRVVAPFDGFVMSGDLRARLGETMPLGTAMFEIARDDGWTIDVEMPQRVAADIRPGEVGVFAPNARPEETIDLQVVRVQPVAHPVDGKTVYITEGELGQTKEWMKPGMEGIARVEFGKRPVWWVGTHRIVDYFRTNFWL